MDGIRQAIVDIVNKNKHLRLTSQSALAKKIGCSPNYLCMMLKGDRRISSQMLEKICAALEIKLSDLEKWNPELAEIRFSHDSAEKAPPELIKAQSKLARLYKANRQSFAGVVAMIEFGLKPAEKPESAKKPAAATG